ncbi:MAG: ABC transporter permease [Candidatus Tectomicrobia bacterium]|uniref:ABC transporter permease n=1 Tax=Tectimicrobiota bacterium TaxID=2528274 RepID=A0A932ZUC4_UNCTE|nr:ABC transporter permease [Candidatus Tectomicrobia bacterium]
MAAFIVRSIFFKTVTLIIISIVSFLIVHLAPGEPSQIDPLNPRFRKEDIARYREAFDLDKPLLRQYFLFYKKFFTGELKSFKDNQPVMGKVWERFLNSLPIFIVGTVLTWCLAFPMGIGAALARGGGFDQVTTFLSYLLISLPGFFLAYLLIIWTVNWFEVPVLGIRTFGQEGAPAIYQVNDRMWHLVLPSLLGATGGIAFLSRYVRGQMIEVLESDYVRTALSKGLQEDTVYYVHALRNAALPFVTMFGLLLPGLIGGSVIIESIFAWPGMGRMAYEAVLTRDYPIIVSLNFISAFLVVVGTFISDILYVIVDPRIRL